MNEIARNKSIEIFMAALDAANPFDAVTASAKEIRDFFDEGGFRSIRVVAFGKAASPMSGALESSLGDLIDGGIVITKYGHLKGLKSEKLKLFEAAHPVPDINGVKATGEALRFVESAGEKDLVVCLISGGGSALLVAPHEGISLEDKQRITDALLRSGTDINELNAVRKHLSGVKGGRLVQKAYPAGVFSLIVSDVVGDPLDVIASGPTAPDTTTFSEAMAVLQKYSIEIPDNVFEFLNNGIAGKIPDTPKEGDKVFRKVQNRIIGSNRVSLEAALTKAEDLGLKAMITNDALTGDATRAAQWLYEKAHSIKERPVCLISGGETTVTVRGSGKGGRNTELALAFALKAKGEEGIALLSAGTDGTDGPTDAAGAFADGTTVPDALSKGLDPVAFLQNNDSYTFFKEAGGLFVTGPTGTNVMDVQVMILT